MSVSDLSEWQLEVARTVATHSYTDAARILGLSPRNVRYHTQRIVLIIGAKNKLDIANVLMRANEL